MESIVDKEKREIRQLSKDFRGMKERFRTDSSKNFKIATSLFFTKIYRAYQLNDASLNEVVRKSYNSVYDILTQRLTNESEKLNEDINEFLFILKPVMDKFMMQSIN